jgi:hypothetical protein
MSEKRETVCVECVHMIPDNYNGFSREERMRFATCAATNTIDEKYDHITGESAFTTIPSYCSSQNTGNCCFFEQITTPTLMDVPIVKIAPTRRATKLEIVVHNVKRLLNIPTTNTGPK